jgi:hypothetical protein
MQASECLKERGILEYYIDPHEEPDHAEKYFTDENNTGNSPYEDAIIVGIFGDDAIPKQHIKIIDPIRAHNSSAELAEILTGQPQPRRHGLANVYQFPAPSPEDC